MLPSFPTAGRREDVPNLSAWFLVLAALSPGGRWEMERGEVVEGLSSSPVARKAWYPHPCGPPHQGTCC